VFFLAAFSTFLVRQQHHHLCVSSVCSKTPPPPPPRRRRRKKKKKKKKTFFCRVYIVVMPRLPSNFAAAKKKKKKKKTGTSMMDSDNNNSEDSSSDDDEEEGGYTVVGEDVTDSSASEGDEEEENKRSEDGRSAPTGVLQRPKVWRPEDHEGATGEGGRPEEMEYDASAYDCLHAFSHEWPSLSFDILKDDMGDERTQFPHAFFMVSGTQADRANKNALSISRVGRLKKTGGGTKTKKKDRNNRNSKNSDKKKNNNNNNENSDDDDSDDSDDDSDSDTDDFDASNPSKSGKPTLHVSSVSHPGGINRIRLMPQNTAICATWSDSGHVLTWDISSAFRSLQNSVEDQKNQNVVNEKKLKIAPKKVHSKHKEEGYALDWSSVTAGRLASGDNTGSIHVWEPNDANATDWNIDCGYTDGHDGKSVEDIQWSPSESTVFASCGGDGGISIWDTRQKPKPAIRVRAAENCDVNVMSWNRLANCMIATGLDDGGLKIWDLRHFDPKGKTNPKPVAQFTFHRGHVSSVDWSPFDSAMLLSAASDNTVCIWDLAVERDAEEEAQAMAENESNAEIPDDLPPQLMFVHQGITDPKEAKFHPQIPGLLVSTALDGFHCFKPFNIGPET